MELAQEAFWNDTETSDDVLANISSAIVAIRMMPVVELSSVKTLEKLFRDLTEIGELSEELSLEQFLKTLLSTTAWTPKGKQKATIGAYLGTSPGEKCERFSGALEKNVVFDDGDDLGFRVNATKPTVTKRTTQEIFITAKTILSAIGNFMWYKLAEFILRQIPRKLMAMVRPRAKLAQKTRTKKRSAVKSTP